MAKWVEYSQSHKREIAVQNVQVFFAFQTITMVRISKHKVFDVV